MHSAILDDNFDESHYDEHEYREEMAEVNRYNAEVTKRNAKNTRKIEHGVEEEDEPIRIN